MKPCHFGSVYFHYVNFAGTVFDYCVVVKKIPQHIDPPSDEKILLLYRPPDH